jgi:hypothetical protein
MRKISSIHRAQQGADLVTRIVGGAVLAAVGFFALRALPDLPRYFRIKRM